MGGGIVNHHLLCVLPFPEPKETIEGLSRRHPKLKVTFICTTNEDVFEAVQGVPDEIWKDVTVLATLGGLPANPEMAPRLELIQFWSAGTNAFVNHPIYTSTTIPLATVSGIHGPNISEWILMNLLVSSHHYDLTHSWQAAQHWCGSHGSSLRTVRDAVGQRLGVLGYGSIGRQTARVCKAMGMDVLAFTAHPRETRESRRDGGFIVPGTGDEEGTIPSGWYSGLERKSLHEFLGQDIDVLVVSVPLTKDTEGLLGKEEFEILARRNAYVVNISRGPIVDTDALIEGLRAFDEDKAAAMGKGRKGLRGAALDVTDPEPLPYGHPLFTAPNCTVSPHISGLGVAYVHRAFQLLEMNFDRLLKGEDLINVVDRKRGY